MASAATSNSTITSQTAPDRLAAETTHRTATQTDYRIARQRDEREAAFGLIYKAYLKTGLARPNPSSMRLLQHHLLPTTDLFVALLAEEVVATVTLVRDGKLGLPIDSVYRQEVTRFRREGKTLGEVSCLADQSNSTNRKSFPRCIELFRLMVQTARARGVDALVVAVNPRHVRFYERYLAFERFGTEAAYPAVCDEPAIALVLDFQRIDRELPTNYARFFGEPIPRELLAAHPMAPAEIAHFQTVLAAGVDPSASNKDEPAAGTPRFLPQTAISDITLGSVENMIAQLVRD